MQIINFRKSYEFEGKKYESVELNFDALTGKNMIDAERLCRASGENSPAIILSTSFALHIASKATKIPVEFFENLHIQDASIVVGAVQTFLMQPAA